MTSRNYYEVLGLANFADGPMVDQAYWHLAKTYQTLAVTDPRARKLLDELNEAYGVLGTPRLREEYDQQLAGASPSPRGKAGRRSGGASRPSKPWFTIALPSWRPFAGRGRDAAPESREPSRAVRPVVVSASARQPASASSTARPTPQPPTVTARSGKSDVGDLRASTARMLERWRANAGIRPGGASAAAEPDTTLVDIFKTERELEAHGDPLTAVMEILRAPKDVVPAKSKP